jgi:putative addiction module component (TIGR02574 family)
MAKSSRELFDEAMRLDPKERAALMRLLVDSLDSGSEEGAEEAWRTEIERRIEVLDSGKVQAVPSEELRARLYSAE